MIMYLLFRINSVVGWRWPYHCLTLVNTMNKLESLLRTLLHLLPVLPISSITKGADVKLNEFRVNCNFLWNFFYEWLTLLVNDALPLILMAVK